MNINEFLNEFRVHIILANMVLGASRMNTTYEECNLTECLEESIKDVSDTFDGLRSFVVGKFNVLKSLSSEEKYKLFSESEVRPKVLSEIRNNIFQMYHLLKDPDVKGINYDLIKNTMLRSVRLYDLFVEEYNEVAQKVGKELLKPISKQPE